MSDNPRYDYEADDYDPTAWTRRDEEGLLINGEPATGVRRVLTERYADEGQVGLITTPEWIAPDGIFFLTGGDHDVGLALHHPLSEECAVEHFPAARVLSGGLVIHRFDEYYEDEES